MRRQISQILQAITTLSLVVALLAVGFAHKSTTSGLSPELEAYVAQGGSLADICGERGGKDPIVPVGCEACRLSDSLSLGGTCSALPPLTLTQTKSAHFIAKLLRHSQSPDPARLTRAPPQA